MKTAVSLALVVTGVLGAPALAQFSPDPAAQFILAGGPGEQIVPRSLLAPDGTYWAWFWSQTGGGYHDLVTRINADGIAPPEWAPSPAGMVYFPDTQTSVALPPAGATDADGNFVVVFVNNSTTPSQLTLQRISPAGVAQLPGAGVTITSGTAAPSNPSLCINADGTYTVGYNRNVGVLQFNGSTAQKARCFYQRLTPAGAPLWAGDGVMMEPDFAFWDNNITPTSSEANKAHYTYGFQNFGVVPSGDGAVVCMVSVNGVTGIRRIGVQRLDSAGAPQWNGGHEVPVSTANSMAFATIPTFITDHAGGAVVGWYDGTTSTSRARVQRVDQDGGLLFPANGSTTSINPSQLQTEPWFVMDPAAGRVYAVTQERNSSQTVRGVNVQAFDGAGERLFGDEGVVVVPMQPTLPGDGTGNVPQFVRLCLTQDGVIAGWFKGLDTSGTVQMIVLASKVSGEGAVAWGPVTVNSGGGNKGRLDMAPIPGGGAVMFYTANTTGTADVYASRLNDDGTLGPPACPGGQCGTQDYNGDGDFGTDQDIEAFFACLAGACCPACFCQGQDFNGDGDFGTDQDIEAFFRVLAGSTSC